MANLVKIEVAFDLQATKNNSILAGNPFPVKIKRNGSAEGGIYLGGSKTPQNSLKIIPLAFVRSKRVDIFNDNFSDSIFNVLLFLSAENMEFLKNTVRFTWLPSLKL